MGSDLLALHPMLTTNDESSPSTKQKTPVLLNEDNIIQSLEDARQEKSMNIKESFSRDRPSKSKGKVYQKSAYSRSIQNHQNSPVRKSFSITKSNVINVSMHERQKVANQATISNISSIYPKSQKYNLELFKKRTKKNSNRIVGKTGLKWSILNNDQNYSSNLPLICKYKK
jgi:hypothetical protein